MPNKTFNSSGEDVAGTFERLAAEGVSVEQALERFVAVTALAVGASHMLRSGDWAETFRLLYQCGRPGAFANGALSLAPGAAIVAGHGSWAWPGAVLTGFGWLLIIKGVVCILAPDKALRSIARGANSPRGFVVAGAVCLVIGGWACYCLYVRQQTPDTYLAPTFQASVR